MKIRMNLVGFLLIATQIALIVAQDSSSAVNNEALIIRYIKGRSFEKALDKLKGLNNDDLRDTLNYVIHDVYNNNERNLDLIILFADKSNDNPNTKVAIFRALNNEIEAKDLLQKLKIIHSINNIPESYSFETPEVEFRDTVSSLAKEEFKESLKSGNCAALHTLAENIEEYYHELFGEALKKALSEVYSEVNKENLLKCLMTLKDKSQRIYGLSGMFNEMKNETDGLNQQLLVNLAFGIKEAAQSKKPKVRLGAQFEAWSFEDQLPTSVRNLVFAQSVCIKNLHYPNEYLYAAVDAYKDYDDRRSVFTYIPGGKVTQGTWIVTRNTDIGDVYHLTNEKHNEYLYATYTSGFYLPPFSRPVYTWMPGGSPKDDDQARWVFEPSGDNMYIKNAFNFEYLYATIDIKLETRRYVRTRLDGSKHEGSLWAIEDCTGLLKLSMNHN